MRRGRRSFASEAGQSVVIVALMFAILMAGGAMAIDVGRFYAERRFLQGAVDAAALACARTYARTQQDAAAAWSAADEVLHDRNLKGNPLGLTVTYPPQGSETYDDNVVAEQNLNGGILPVSTSGLGCRVAITVAVPTYLIKVVSPALNVIGMTTRAYAKAKGGMLPSVVKRYENASDNDGVDNGSPNEFIDHTMAQNADSSCTVSNPAGCTPASLANKGQEFVLFGASQKANNDSSFRGYIGLDIRDFSTEVGGALQHDSYNGVAADASVNTLKDFEAQWIDKGYPGPDICAVTPGDFKPCAQIAAINGSSSGIFIDEYERFFRSFAQTSSVGDIILLQLYDGTVKKVPDFTMNPPTLTVPASGSVPPVSVPYSMSTQFAASAAQICTEVIPDNGTVTNGGGDTTGRDPFVTGAIPLAAGTGLCTGRGANTFASNPTPVGASTYGQTWSPGTATAAQRGIYQVFLRGTASEPYTSRVHSFPVKVFVGGQTRDYVTTASVTQRSVSMASLPASVSFTAVVETGTGSNKWRTSGSTLDGPVTVSWDSCPRDDTGVTVLTCYIGSPGITSTSVTAGNTVSLTVSTSGVATQRTYVGWVRTTGYSNGGYPVTHLWEVRLDVDQATGGTTDYVDVIGYAAFEITNITSNDVYGRAVSGAYYDPNDPSLAIAKKIVLVPWETP